MKLSQSDLDQFIISRIVKEITGDGFAAVDPLKLATVLYREGMVKHNISISNLPERNGKGQFVK